MKMKLWETPKCYMGASWFDYYVFLGQHRDSDKVTRSNFRVAMKAVRAIETKYPDYYETSDGKDMIVNPYESHWAVGHIEWIGIHKNAPAELIEACERMLEQIEDYPLLDESDHSELEFNEAADYWQHSSIRERLDWLTDTGIPCFAARHDISTIMHVYDNKADRLWERLTTN